MARSPPVGQSGGRVSGDRSDEVRELEALDNPDGAELLDDIDDYLARFVVYPSEHERRAHALWIAHTWLMDCWESTPRFAFQIGTWRMAAP